MVARFQAAFREPIHALRTRIHGDYHLGQVLYTGSDFVLIDFEGEPARSLAERRMKQSPMQDVAGMLRSFHYAAFAPLFGPMRGKSTSSARRIELSARAEKWHTEAANRFLSHYLAASSGAAYLPEATSERNTLLSAYLLAKALYELNYELNNRPAWVEIPVEGILNLLSGEGQTFD
jgi:maltose alpha-D-glucosyltransferase/alpha-amylase